MRKMTTAQMIASQNYNTLDDLFARRQKWEEGAYKASNEQLYDILKHCYSLYMSMYGETAVIKAFKTQLKESNHCYQDNTTLPTAIVRFVFDKNNNRTFAYARVLTVAKEVGIDPAKFIEFIENSGGIEEIRKVKNGETPKEQNSRYFEIASEHFASEKSALHKISNVDCIKKHNENEHAFSLGLFRDEGDGTCSLVYGTNKPTLVKTVLIEAGKGVAEKSTENKKIQDQNEAMKTQDKVLEAAQAENVAKSTGEG